MEADLPLTTQQLLHRINQGKDGRQIKADVVAGTKRLAISTGAIHPPGLPVHGGP